MGSPLGIARAVEDALKPFRGSYPTACQYRRKKVRELVRAAQS